MNNVHPSEQSLSRVEGYPRESVGEMMSRDVAAVGSGLRVDEAMEEVRRLNASLSRLLYVYVVNSVGELIGVLSMRDLILARPEARLSEIMRTGVTRLSAMTDREAGARRIVELGLLGLPVTDGANRLVGQMSLEQAAGVLEEEVTEDVQRMFGAGAEERLDTPWWTSARQRLPWLVVNLFLASVGALVVSAFETTISTVTVLAIYMPVVAGMGGNATAQAMAVAIRGIALGEGDGIRLRRVVVRELVVGVLAGLLTGVLAGVIALVVHSDRGVWLGGIVAFAMVVNLMIGCLWGVAVPFAMRRLGFDPAQSATIFTTTVTDLVGFVVLLTLAAILMTGGE